MVFITRPDGVVSYPIDQILYVAINREKRRAWIQVKPPYGVMDKVLQYSDAQYDSFVASWDAAIANKGITVVKP